MSTNVTIDEITEVVTVADSPAYLVNANTPAPITSVSTSQPSITINPSPTGIVDLHISSPSVDIEPVPAAVIELAVGIPTTVSDEEKEILAMTPESLIVGIITRSITEAAISANVVWPDGVTGTYVGVESSTVPGAIDSYTITYGSSRTYHQPTITRDGSGAVTNRPAIIVS